MSLALVSVQADEKGMPILVIKDRKTKYMTAHMVPRKGGHPYAIDRLTQDIDNILGYRKIALKSDHGELLVETFTAQCVL